MSLAEESAARKARLEALRKRKAGIVDEENENQPVQSRNFDPETRTARKHQKIDDTVESAVEGLADQIIKEDETKRAEELNLLNIAPKRANWDLKRDLERISQKLKPKTEEAIRTTIRTRLASQKKGDNSMDVVGALEALQQIDDDVEEEEED